MLWVPLSKIFTMAIPEISPTNGALTFISFYSFGFNTRFFSGNMGTDLFKNLKQQSLEFITPSNLNTFFIPRTKSTFSCISDTNVQISNLCLCMSMITGMTNNTLTHWPFPTCILWVFDKNFSNEWSDLHCI